MKRILLASGIPLLALASCKKSEDIRVYRISRDQPEAGPQTLAGDPHAGIPGMDPNAGPAGDPHAGVPGMDPHAGIPGMDPHAGIPGMGGDPHAGLSPAQMAGVGTRAKVQVQDSPPPTWTKRPPSSIRQLSYQADGADGASADISLIILRGAAGHDLANINRWREQQGLSPIDEETLKAEADTFATPAGEAVAVDLQGMVEGADPKIDGRMIGVIATRGRDAWFFKMRGNQEVVAAYKTAYLNWVRSVEPLETDETPQAGPAEAAAPPQEASPTPTAEDKPGGGADGLLTWKIPAGWTQQANAGTMRYATLTATTPAGERAEMAITRFPGDVGGDLDNVNRWRDQIGLPAIRAAELPTVVQSASAIDMNLSVIDFSHNGKRVTAAWTRHGENTWFFKFSGSEAAVASHRAAFDRFVQSLHFPKSEP